MSVIPADLRYSDTHEWVRDNEDGTVTVGITDHAQGHLGTLGFIDLPKIDRSLSAGAVIAVIEAEKSASEVYAPVSGTVIEINERLEETPTLVNESCYDEGWIARLQIGDATDLDALKTPNEYYLVVRTEKSGDHPI